MRIHLDISAYGGLECGVVEHKEEMDESEVTPIKWVSDVGDTLNSEH